MAVVAGTITNVFGHTTPGGPKVNGSGNAVLTCVIAATFTGTYAQSDNAQISAVPTAIQDSRRDGKTVTILQSCMEFPGDEAGTIIGAKTVAVSTNDITLELTGSDLTTEHSGAALGTMTSPIGFRVLYVLS